MVKLRIVYMLMFFSLVLAWVLGKHFCFISDFIFLVFSNLLLLEYFSCVDLEFLNVRWLYLLDPQTNVLLLTGICKRLFTRMHNLLIMIRQGCVYIVHFYCQLWFYERLFFFYSNQAHYTSFELCYSLLVYTMIDVEMRFLDDLILEGIYLAKIFINDIFFPYDSVVQLPPTLLGPPLVEVCHTDPEFKEFKVVHTTPAEKLLLLGVFAVGLVLGLTMFSTDRFFYMSYWRDQQF